MNAQSFQGMLQLKQVGQYSTSLIATLANCHNLDPNSLNKSNTKIYVQFSRFSCLVFFLI